WGSSLSSTSAGVQEMRAFRNGAGALVEHTSMLGQYGAYQSNLVGSQVGVFDSTNPSSARVTDAMVQAEVKKWFSGKYDTNTIYESSSPAATTLMTAREHSRAEDRTFSTARIT